MEQKVDHKTELKEKLVAFYNTNKLKIFAFLSILIATLVLISILQINNKKKNILISEKYINAGLYLSLGEKEKSKNLYNEIIFSENKFYSILALNTILENDLASDEEEIFNYFKIVEGLKINQEQKDLISFKKALFFIKNSNLKEGNEILKNLIEKNSKLKLLAEEIIVE